MLFTMAKASVMFLLGISLVVFDFLALFWSKDILSQANKCYIEDNATNAIVDVYHSLSKSSYDLSLAALILTLICTVYYMSRSHPWMFELSEYSFFVRAIGLLSATGTIIVHFMLTSIVCFHLFKTVKASYLIIAPSGTCSFAKVNDFITFEWINFALILAIVLVSHWWPVPKESSSIKMYVAERI